MLLLPANRLALRAALQVTCARLNSCDPSHTHGRRGWPFHFPSSPLSPLPRSLAGTQRPIPHNVRPLRQMPPALCAGRFEMARMKGDAPRLMFFLFHLG